MFSVFLSLLFHKYFCVWYSGCWCISHNKICTLLILSPLQASSSRWLQSPRTRTFSCRASSYAIWQIKILWWRSFQPGLPRQREALAGFWRTISVAHLNVCQSSVNFGLRAVSLSEPVDVFSEEPVKQFNGSPGTGRDITVIPILEFAFIQPPTKWLLQKFTYCITPGMCKNRSDWLDEITATATRIFH